MEISLTSMLKIAKALKVKVRDLVDELQPESHFAGGYGFENR